MAKPKTHKKPRVGSQNKMSPESKKLTKKQTKKHERREGKNQKLDENANIIGFIKSLSEKKYASANKYLQQLVNQKLKAKIAKAAGENLF